MIFLDTCLVAALLLMGFVPWRGWFCVALELASLKIFLRQAMNNHVCGFSVLLFYLLAGYREISGEEILYKWFPLHLPAWNGR